jgi:anti-sigma regulatory factor (Ser/Thr protein kinase)
MNLQHGRGPVVLDREYAGQAGSLLNVRRDVAACLQGSGFGPELEERAQLVVSELATNAIEASPGTRYGICVSLNTDRSVVLQVKSSSDRVPPPRDSWRPVTQLAPRGRGLLIVGELSDHVDIAQLAPSTVVVTATLSPARLAR